MYKIKYLSREELTTFQGKIIQVLYTYFEDNPYTRRVTGIDVLIEENDKKE